MPIYVISLPPPPRGGSRPTLYWQCGRWVPVPEAATRYATFEEADAVCNMRGHSRHVMIIPEPCAIVVHASDVGWGFMERDAKREREKAAAAAV